MKKIVRNIVLGVFAVVTIALVIGLNVSPSIRRTYVKVYNNASEVMHNAAENFGINLPEWKITCEETVVAFDGKEVRT